MIVCPDWDAHLWNEVKQISHTAFFLSATAIEPIPQSNCSIEADFGRTLDEFEEERLLKEYSFFSKADWNGATWTPNLVHVRYWDLVGGYSEEFSPGMYSEIGRAHV